MDQQRHTGLYRFLERPRIYSAVQAAFGFGGMDELKQQFAEFIDNGESTAALELGCGTGHWPLTRFEKYVRTDINADYFPENPEPGVEYRKMDAVDLEGCADGEFDLVYSVGLYHHLPEDAVVASLRESARVVSPAGRIVICDAILPTRWWALAPLLIRKLDRGQWVRKESGTTALIERAGLSIRRRSTCSWGLFRLQGCFWELGTR